MATSFALLRDREPDIDAGPARERFDSAYVALDDNLEGDYIDGCPIAKIEDIMSRFVRATRTPQLYDPLDRGEPETYVFFDANVSRPLLQCGFGGGERLLYRDSEINDVGLMVTRPYEHGLEQFTVDLLASKPDDRDRCREIDVEDLDDYAGGKVQTVTCIHDDEYQNVDFREIAWSDGNLMVLFATAGRGSVDLDPELLRAGMIAALPAVIESVERAEPVEPADVPD